VTRWWRRRAERGSVSIEVAILAPAFLGMLALAGVVGRTAVAAQAVESAAHDAARAASISRDAGTARTAARDAVLKRLDWSGISCDGDPTLAFGGSVAGQPTAFDRAYTSSVGSEAAVSVRVTCRVSYRALQMSTLPGMPSERRISAVFVSPLDRYRSRG
jgi:Flp pilus assembly protein TadG